MMSPQHGSRARRLPRRWRSRGGRVVFAVLAAAAAAGWRCGWQVEGAAWFHFYVYLGESLCRREASGAAVG